MVLQTFQAKWPLQQSLSFGLFAYKMNNQGLPCDGSIHHVGVVHFTPDDFRKVNPPEQYKVTANFSFQGTELCIEAQCDQTGQKLQTAIGLGV